MCQSLSCAAPQEKYEESQCRVFFPSLADNYPGGADGEFRLAMEHLRAARDGSDSQVQSLLGVSHLTLIRDFLSANHAPMVATWKRLLRTESAAEVCL